MVDRLAKIASGETQNEEGIPIKTIINQKETHLIQPIQLATEDWVDKIMKLIQQGTLPNDIICSR